MMARRAFAQYYASIMPVPRLASSAHSHSCFGHLPFELLHSTLHGAAFEEYLEILAGSKCNNTQLCMIAVQHTVCNTSILHSALLPVSFLVNSKCCCDLWSPSWHRSRFLAELSLPLPIILDPTREACSGFYLLGTHLGAPRKKVFAFMVLAFWCFLSPREQTGPGSFIMPCRPGFIVESGALDMWLSLYHDNVNCGWLVFFLVEAYIPYTFDILIYCFYIVLKHY